MSGLFQGLQIGKQALMTHQVSINTIGHNMTNASTVGYSRQEVNLTTAIPNENANYILGNGVKVSSVTQVRDSFLTAQYRRQSQMLGEWSYRDKTMGQLESIIAEPTDSGLGNILDEFWNSWATLSSPDNVDDVGGARPDVLAQAQSLIDAFHSLDTQLEAMYSSTNEDILGQVEEINLISREIANLNELIVGEELGGAIANDLRDQRDYLVDQLSGMVNVSTNENKDGSLTVYIGGMALVERADTFQLSTKLVENSDKTKHEIVWENSKRAVDFDGGKLKGLLDTRDETIPKYQEMLDNLAETIVTELNTLHSQGYTLEGETGYNFFDPEGLTAGTIALSSDIEDNPERIAASLSGEPGDNSNALAIYDLRDQAVMSGGSASITEYYNQMVGSIGVEAQESTTFHENYDSMLLQIENSRQSVQGVSLDEEMANLIIAQQSYSAAAKLITYIDEALDTVINGMGIVGR